MSEREPSRISQKEDDRARGVAATSSFDLLVERLRVGDDDAAQRVFERFARRLVTQAQNSLDSAVRQKVDAEDVIQSVFKSFFARQRDGEFQLAGWDSIWGLLTLITLRKCRNRFDYFYAARRDVRREERLERPDMSQRGLEVLASDPSPEEAAVLTETLERLMSGLDEREQSILSLQLQGYTIREISERVGRAERTVRRVLDRIKRRLGRLHEVDAQL